MKVFYPKWTRKALIEELRRGLEALRSRLPLRKVVLFGSWAQGRQTVASDIDLLVVYAGEPREDAFRLVKELLDFPGLEPHVYSEAEYECLESKLERMTHGGVVLLDEMKPEHKDSLCAYERKGRI